MVKIVGKDNQDLTGMYLRKRVASGVYNASSGWQRKWTYKIGWVWGDSSIRLVAMSDGMITSYEFNKDSLSEWVMDNDMVVMTEAEVMQFIQTTSSDMFAPPLDEFPVISVPE